jgi:MFS family permease
MVRPVESLVCGAPLTCARIGQERTDEGSDRRVPPDRTAGPVGDEQDSRYAWLRLSGALVLGTIGTVGMWSYVVTLPAVQAEFAIARADATLPYTLAMVGFAAGSMLMGWLSDRFGVLAPVVCGAIALGIGYSAAGYANFWQLAFAYGLIGVGSSAAFVPLMTEISQWFTRRRGIAVVIASCGNYLSGALWSPLIERSIAANGWRETHMGIALICVVTMLPLALLALRRHAPMHPGGVTGAPTAPTRGTLGLSPNALTALLSVAAIGCCVAMATPQVQIVAYCGDLGYGAARGAEMLSLMLAFGVVSRVASGWIADRIGGLAALLIGSGLQGVALLLFAAFDSLASLYVISGLFGLFQGGVVPMYVIIVREYFPAREAGTRVGIIVGISVVGMALGGWGSGAIFDLTGSYSAAFLHGFLWNVLNAAIVLWLLMRSGWGPARRLAPA